METRGKGRLVAIDGLVFTYRNSFDNNSANRGCVRAVTSGRHAWIAGDLEPMVRGHFAESLTGCRATFTGWGSR